MDKVPITTSQISIDEAISLLGGFRQFQWLLDAAFCLILTPIAFQILLMTFAAIDSPWVCVVNSTICKLNGTQTPSEQARCDMPRTEWTYVHEKHFSLSTEFDLSCENAWITHLLTSVVFIGWAIGAIVLGSIADNYGRKKVIYPSTAIIIIVGLICSFLGNITMIVICRFVIGFFIPGANVQTYILVLEYVGSRQRPLAGFILFISFQVNLCVLALQAYFIQSWKILSVVCTAPYLLALLTYAFVPESVRWLRYVHMWIFIHVCVCLCLL